MWVMNRSGQLYLEEDEESSGSPHRRLAYWVVTCQYRQLLVSRQTKPTPRCPEPFRKITISHSRSNSKKRKRRKLIVKMKPASGNSVLQLNSSKAKAESIPLVAGSTSPSKVAQIYGRHSSRPARNRHLNKTYDLLYPHAATERTQTTRHHQVMNKRPQDQRSCRRQITPQVQARRCRRLDGVRDEAFLRALDMDAVRQLGEGGDRVFIRDLADRGRRGLGMIGIGVQLCEDGSDGLMMIIPNDTYSDLSLVRVGNVTRCFYPSGSTTNLSSCLSLF